MNELSHKTKLDPPRLVRFLARVPDNPVVQAGGRNFWLKPNPKYGGDLILEVDTQGAFNWMMRFPTVYEVAADWEEERNGAEFIERLKRRKEMLVALLEEWGFVRQNGVGELVGAARDEEAVPAILRRNRRPVREG